MDLITRIEVVRAALKRFEDEILRDHAPHYVTELMEKDALMRFARELS